MMMKVCQFYPSTHDTSLECCAVSKDVMQWQSNLSHASIEELRGVSTPMLMIGSHGISYTTPKVEPKSVSVFIHLPMVHHWGIVWSALMLSPCLVVCTMVDLPHPYIQLRGVSIPVWMTGAVCTSHTILGKG